MPNRVLKDGIYASDKLAACVDSAQVTINRGDLAKLAYPYVLIPQQDDWGCFELNPRVLRNQCFLNFQIIPPLEELTAWLQLWNHNGLLFVWEHVGKAWTYVTGREAGRLPEPSRRHKRKTPTLYYDRPKKDTHLEIPCEQWPEVRCYLDTYGSLQPDLHGLLLGFKCVHLTYDQLRSTYKLPTSSYAVLSTAFTLPSLARAGANLDPNPEPHLNPKHELNPNPELSYNSQLSRSVTPKTERKLPIKHDEERKTTTTLQENTDQLQKHSTLPQVATILSQADTGMNGGSLRRNLEKAIDRNRLFATYDDWFIHQSREKQKDFGELCYEVTRECVKLLLTARGFKELPGMEVEQLVKESWVAMLKGLPRFEHVKNYEKRKHVAGAAIINCVVDAALRLRGEA